MSSNQFGMKTVKIINDLNTKEVKKIAVIMRHSIKQVDPTNPSIEPYMGLTAEGKEMARLFGRELPSGKALHFFSSSVGRCIETAYLIDKGYTAKGGETADNKLLGILAPFYVKTSPLLTVSSQPEGDFLRLWFDGKLPVDTIDPPQAAAGELLGYLVKKTQKSDANDMGIYITHDWNIYLLKECILGLRHEEYGAVDFLEGIVIYEEDDAFYIAHHQCASRSIPRFP